MPSDSRLLTSQCVPLFLRHLEARGLDTAALKRRYALPRDVERQAEVKLALSRVWSLSDACAALAQDDLLGFHLATEPLGETYGLLRYAVLHSATAQEALGRLVKSGALVNELVTFTVVEKPARGTVVLEHALPGQRACVGRQCNEFFVGLFVSVARELMGDQFKLVSVRFAHEEHSQGDALRASLGCRVAFGDGVNSIEFRTAGLERPLVRADPQLAKMLDQQAQRELAGRSRPRASTAAARVMALLPQLHAKGDVTVAAAARRLGVGSRSLQRALAAERKSFRAVVDVFRRRVAEADVRAARRSFDDIAQGLGFSDVRAFRRAFKRWTGKTPSRFRARKPRG